MKIGIDARFVGPQGTGLGKYTEKLITNLLKVDKKNEYRIFLRKQNWDYLKLTRNFKKVLADTPWYSLKEQILLPKVISSQNLDLLHVPHFNAPIFYKRKFIVTIHDLIHHHFSETSATTKNPLTFKVKRLAYKAVISNAIKRSKKILAPSRFVKNEILKYFKVPESKIVVTYEAAEEEYFTKPTTNYPPPTTQYLLYVGNAYPHKNLNRLLDAFKILNTKYKIHDTKLILVCPRNVFSRKLKEEVAKRDLDQTVELKGYLSAGQLSKLFTKSSAYVFPSLSEGFGIPGLNAMASHIPVVSSNIPVLKEVYGEAALYFDPTKPEDIASKIKTILTNSQVRSDLVLKGENQVKKYSWQKMAEETLRVYEEIS